MTTTTVPARPQNKGDLNRAVMYEWIRLRTLRSSKWAAGWIVGLSLLFGLSLGMDVRGLPDGSGIGADLALQNLNIAAEFTGIPLLGLVAGILGILSMTHEHRYATIRPVFVAVPRRTDVLLAKTSVLSCAAAVLTCISVAVILLTATAVSGGRLVTAAPPFGDLFLAVLPYPGVVVLCAVAGLALGALTRSTALALALWLVVPLIGETAVFVAFHAVDALDPVKGLANWLPFRSAQKSVASSDFDLMPRLAGLAAFAGWVGCLASASLRAVLRRDV
ncbi:ABC transporter permease [Streptomyces erythrochromogenes]|uniref:ABC transporter permease n=1 Tax=Streptomyces erythrochromogenes TaxID=285574 RepID=UPI0036B27F5F